MGRSIILAGMLLVAVMAMSGGARVSMADESGPEGMLSLAQEAEARGDNRMAIALYRRAQEAYPWASAPLTGWGRLAARLGAAEQAATLLTAALDIDPDDIDAAAGLAEVMLDLQRPEEALVLYETVLSLDPSDPAAIDGRLAALAQLDRPEPGTTATALAGPSLANAETTVAPAAQAVPALIETSLPVQSTAGPSLR